MGSPAEQLNFEDGQLDYTKGQVAALEQREMKAPDVIGVQNLRNSVGKQIRDARIDDSISEKDALKLQEDLQANETDQQEIRRVSSNVKKVISESKQLIADFRSDVLDAKVLDTEGELATFKILSLEEKRAYRENLGKKIEDLQGLYKKIAKVLPDELSKLEKLKGREREEFAKELKERCANIELYDTYLEEGKKHFSQATREEFASGFKELSRPKQQEWITQFEKDQLRPRVQLTLRFEALPPSYRKDIPDFFDLDRHVKAEMLDRVEDNLAFDTIVDKSGDSPYVADKAKVFAKDTFRSVPETLRKDMLKMLEKHLKAEADLYRRFKALPTQVRDQYPDFVQRSFEVKEKILNEALEAEGLRKEYGVKLQMEFLRKNIGKDTFQDFMLWFQRQDLKGKKNGNQEFEEQMRDRRQLRKSFEKLPKKVQAANPDFYNLSHHERLKRYEDLTKLSANGEKAVAESLKESPETAKLKTPEKSDKQVQIKGLLQKAEELEAVRKPKEALHIYQTVLIFDAGNEFALQKMAELLRAQKDESNPADEFSEGDVSRAAKEMIASDSSIRDEAVVLNIAEGIDDLARNSDRYNRGVSRAEDKNAHLRSEEERVLNERLLEFTDGESVIGQEDGMAEKVEKVDLARFDDRRETSEDLRKLVVEHPDEKSQQNVHNLQLITTDGQQTSGDIGKSKVEARRADLTLRIAKKALERRKERTGKPVDAKAAESLAGKIKEKDLKLDLKQYSS